MPRRVHFSPTAFFSFLFSLSLSCFLMELYWVWTHGNLVRVKSRCRDASLLTLAQFHFQYQRSWNVSDFLSPTQKSSQSTLSEKKMFWNMESTPDAPRRCLSGSTRCADVVKVFFQCASLHFGGFCHVFYKWTVQNVSWPRHASALRETRRVRCFSSSFSSRAALTLGNSHPQSLPL